jgi:hypothetical protein
LKPSRDALVGLDRRDDLRTSAMSDSPALDLWLAVVGGLDRSGAVSRSSGVVVVIIHQKPPALAPRALLGGAICQHT